MLFYLLALAAFLAWRNYPRPWTPSVIIETPHFHIASTATQAQTEELARRVEILYTAYSNLVGSIEGFRSNHPKLKLRLYKDRDEFRRLNPGIGWAEAFYKKPYSRAYYSADEVNPCHWMLHEVVHQLNQEVANLSLSKWLEEGLAEYFSTSRIDNGRLLLGQIDPDTYPIWWIDEIATASSLQANLDNGSLIPLAAIIRNFGGPLMNSRVNLYYLHWLTLTHFVFETDPCRENALKLLAAGGSLKSFKTLIGPVETIQPRWHDHTQSIKRSLLGPMRSSPASRGPVSPTVYPPETTAPLTSM